ncbi:cupin [Laceyella putida]|uniref:Cupin n=1 Tax=Laceyella putida TaxID=110101 RepID=A0ABW2RFK1_9BACL
MRIFRFNTHLAKRIDKFDSQNAFVCPVLRTNGFVQVGCFFVQPEGRIGMHPAVTNQLLMVVQGKGWVRSNTSAPVFVEMGDAIYWEEGEWHEAGSDDGMMAFVWEGKTLNPGQFMLTQTSETLT